MTSWDLAARRPGEGIERVSGGAGAAARVAPANRLGTGPRNPYARALGPGLILAAWSAGSALGLLDDRWVPAPWAVATTASELIADGYLQSNIVASLHRAFLGLFLGVSLGVILAVTSGISRLGEALVDGPVQIKRAIPTLGLIPLMILWFGIGETMKITVITLAVMVPVYINTHAAVTGIDNRFVELAETVGLDRGGFIWRVVLPGALPGFFVGLRIAVTSSWTGLVVVEQINAESGIGYMMAQAQLYGQTSIIFVGLVVYGLFGWVADTAVRLAQKSALKWQRTLAN